MNTIRVVVADDHPIVRRGIKYELEAASINVVGEATDGEETLELVHHLQPDVLIVDVKMPKLSGIEVVRHLRATKKMRRAGMPVPILALSAFDNEATVLAMLKAGATGYILKDELPETIVMAVKSTLQGKPWISPCLLARVTYLITNDTSLNYGLSERELQVLRLMACGKGNKQIGNELHLATQTVKNHVCNIYNKLGVNSRVAAAIRAISLGIIELHEIE
ncbi:MAG: response regulator [Ardenticatenaceae bacterium]